jgi:hypothetical protein
MSDDTEKNPIEEIEAAIETVSAKVVEELKAALALAHARLDALEARVDHHHGPVKAAAAAASAPAPKA